MKMASIQVRSQVSLDELLTGVEQLDNRQLNHFIDQALTLRARRLAPSLSKNETRLLHQINRGLSSTAQRRYDELTAKRRAETLTAKEQRELLTLIDRIERADAERAQAVIKLAQLRRTSVVALADELGLRPAAHG
jgi:hypothetical protein